MKFATKRQRARRSGGVNAFTLAEVLAALVFMAIVIPVALQGLRIAGRAGEVAERKREAARVAERILNENIILTNWNRAALNGTVQEADRNYNWTLRTETWTETTTQSAMQLLTVSVEYPVQGDKYTVELSTLAAPN
ncbi:MAG: type II secretion system GspH family protein [Verrucomicrobiae bacterium]|nr:type II secretion system GspH family protein [Verrucomicrobiae bacterium]